MWCPGPSRRFPDQCPAWINPWFCRGHSAQDVWSAIIRRRRCCNWDGACHGRDHDRNHHGWTDRAAFAAQLGTMEVNEEIDALKTLDFPDGVSRPTEDDSPSHHDAPALRLFGPSGYIGWLDRWDRHA